MRKLNLPEFGFSTRIRKENPEIFDAIRKKYVALTPEEWVRQNYLRFLIEKKHFPARLIAVEKMIKVNAMRVRPDVVVYANTGHPLVIVECKAPEVKITQAGFDQIAKYNYSLQANYLIVTNGITHYQCLINYQTKSYAFLKEIPEYNNLIGDKFKSP